ncbi:MAG: oligoendopeptidase F [Thermovirga sp.]|nr:oligoendopeptidase F [Thermovirga sp.]
MKILAQDHGPGAGRTIPDRSALDRTCQWALEDLFADRAEWEKAFEETGPLMNSLEAFRGDLSTSPSKLLECLMLRDRLGELTSRVYAYAHMKSHEDTRDHDGQALAARATTLAVAASRSGAFITPEILSIPEETLSHYLEKEKGLEIYRFFLEELLRKRDHVLSPKEEELLAASAELAHAPENIFSMLTNADIAFPPIRDELGREVPFSEERFGPFLQSADRRVREDAYKNLYGVYGQYRNTLSASLNAALRASLFYSRVRGFGSNLEAALHEDDIPISVYGSLVEGVREGLDALHRYVDLRRRVLGISPVRMFDLYVPLVDEYRREIPYHEAIGMVREGLAPLGEAYLAALEEGFANRWADVYENRGKRGGAYSWGAYPVHPYVLLNYNGKMRDVFTVAHEMGHALHRYFSDRKQPYIYSGHSIFIAEVASTTNEALLLDHLIGLASNRDERIYFLNYRLEQIRTTVFRQTLFAEYEREIHERTEKGEALTADEFCRLWRDLNAEYYGPAVELNGEIEMEWARIPHFYSPFYVYQYATGYSAAIALSRGILFEGDAAAHRYMRFLERGSSASAMEVLRDAGVDMANPEPVKKTVDLFRSTVEELETLLA